MPNQTELKPLRCDRCLLACCGSGHGAECIPEPCEHEGETCPCGGTMRLAHLAKTFRDMAKIDRSMRVFDKGASSQ